MRFHKQTLSPWSSGVKNWYGLKSVTPPKMNSVLIVDDRDYYAEELEKEVKELGAVHVTRARTAAEGIAIIENRHEQFDGIISDISMETEYAGTRVLGYARKIGYKGKLSVATTSLDFWYGLYTTGMVFRYWFRVDFMLPKRAIKQKGTVVWLKGC